MKEASEIAQAMEFINDKPEGFKTEISQGGTNVSGGQKQRISIARALVKNPSILILDDSLSAVDTATEEEILENIKGVLRNRTGIIISHRVSTVKHADEILFMDKGRIVERGTHSDLMSLQGSYYTLFRTQMNQETDTDEVAI